MTATNDVNARSIPSDEESAPPLPVGLTLAQETRLKELLRRAFDLGAADKEEMYAALDEHGVECFYDWLMNSIDRRITELEASA